MLPACAQEQLPPVEDTAPSEDSRILQAQSTMSDGSTLDVHMTETVTSDIEMVSNGYIGGMTIDAQGNIYNTNFQEAVCFVWGGKWAHFDNIHFEDRPEILLYNRLISAD